MYCAISEVFVYYALYMYVLSTEQSETLTALHVNTSACQLLMHKNMSVHILLL